MNTPNPKRRGSAEASTKDERIERRKAGHGFVRPGDPYKGFFFLHAGKLSVYKEGGDAIAYTDPGSCLEAQFHSIEDGVWQATIIAEEDVAVEIYAEAQLGRMLTAYRARAVALEERIARLEDEALQNLHLIDEVAEENAALSARAEAAEAGQPERIAEVLALRETLGAAETEVTEQTEKVASLNELVRDLFRTGAAGASAEEWMARVDRQANELWEDFTGVADRMTTLELQLLQTRADLAAAEAKNAELVRTHAATRDADFDAAISSGIDELALRGRVETEVKARFQDELDR